MTCLMQRARFIPCAHGAQAHTRAIAAFTSARALCKPSLRVCVPSPLVPTRTRLLEYTHTHTQTQTAALAGSLARWCGVLPFTLHTHFPHFGDCVAGWLVCLCVPALEHALQCAYRFCGRLNKHSRGSRHDIAATTNSHLADRTY